MAGICLTAFFLALDFLFLLGEGTPQVYASVTSDT